MNSFVLIDAEHALLLGKMMKEADMGGYFRLSFAEDGSSCGVSFVTPHDEYVWAWVPCVLHDNYNALSGKTFLLETSESLRFCKSFSERRNGRVRIEHGQGCVFYVASEKDAAGQGELFPYTGDRLRWPSEPEIGRPFLRVTEKELSSIIAPLSLAACVPKNAMTSLSSVVIEPRGDGLLARATNGYVLAMVEFAPQMPADWQARTVVWLSRPLLRIVQALKPFSLAFCDAADGAFAVVANHQRAGVSVAILSGQVHQVHRDSIEVVVRSAIPGLKSRSAPLDAMRMAQTMKKQCGLYCLLFVDAQGATVGRLVTGDHFAIEPAQRDALTSRGASYASLTTSYLATGVEIAKKIAGQDGTASVTCSEPDKPLVIEARRPSADLSLWLAIAPTSHACESNEKR